MQQPQQAALAGAGRSQQPPEPALWDLERQIVQDCRRRAAPPIVQPDPVQPHHPTRRPNHPDTFCHVRRTAGTGLFSPAPGLYHEGMKIVCPSCSAAYEVPRDRLAPGRIVRCARCSADWVPVALPVAAPVPVAPVPMPAPPTVRAAEPAQAFTPPIGHTEPAPPARRRAAVSLAWLLTFAVLGAAGWAAYTYRPDIVRIWPPSERAYLALGLR